MPSTNAQAAEALYPILSAFHAVQGHALRRIQQVILEGSLASLTFDFGSMFLTAKANEDDDTVDIAISPSNQLATDGTDVSGVQPWSDFIGRSFGWGWLIVNQQGYNDGVLLSFDGIDPQLLLNVIASSIKVSRVMGVPS